VPVATLTARTPCMVLVVDPMVYMVRCRIARQFARHSLLPALRSLEQLQLVPILLQTSQLAIGQITFSADTTTLPSLRLDSLQEEEVPMLTSTVHMDGPLEEMRVKTVMIFAVDTANCTSVSASLLDY